MSQFHKILKLLADGKFHSGEQLGNLLGVSRSAVWQTLKRLLDPSLELHAVRGRGYRIPGGLELLDVTAICAAINDYGLVKQLDIEIFDSIDSTNSYLLSKVTNRSGLVCLAEQQTAGRGRRGRSWVSPFGRNIYLSLLWHFSGGSTSLAGLSLAVGVAVVNALQNYGLANIGLKWPNDIVYNHSKLGGILIEMAGDAAGPCQVVIGVGLNLEMPKTGEASGIEQSWIDMRTLLQHQPVERNRLVGLILRELLLTLPQFQQHGLTYFQPRWQQLDVLTGKPVAMHLAEKQLHGIAEGIDPQGNLLVKIDGDTHRFHSGEVSVRLE